MSMTSSHVRRTARDCVSFLRASLDGDWNASVPGLDFSVLGIVAHAAAWASGTQSTSQQLAPISSRSNIE